MRANVQWQESLKRFMNGNNLAQSFLALDLDGTALLEDHGKVFISSSVEKGVKALRELEIPVVLNSLRFPLSVINTVGTAWYQIAAAPIPVVLLNGSTIGQIFQVDDKLRYEEHAAHPLGHDAIHSMIAGVAQLTKAGIDDILLFFYPRDWKQGETLWTPKAARIPPLRKKFVSASRIISGPVETLAEELFRCDVCMISLFIDRPADTLMAYQHSKRSSFFTAQGVDKASGLREVATNLGLSPRHALGAGDTEMAGVALALLSGLLFAAYMINLRRTADVHPIFLTWVNNGFCSLALLVVVYSQLALTSAELAILSVMGAVQLGFCFVPSR